MKELITATQKVLQENKHPLPFSVYTSIQEQHILNVPVLKPQLICILSGIKKLGNENEIVCPSGNFIFLSNHPTIEMRNIPNDNAYFAVVIEFEYADFDQFKHTQKQTQNYLQGEINGLLIKALQQYIEWASDAPPETWHFRRQELLQLIYLSGYEDVGAMVKPPSLSHQLHNIINHNIADEWPVERLAEQLAISDSTLRRKLKSEGTDIQTIRNQAKLNHALYLVQTTMEPIGRIAQHCGYDSQSRFTEKFKHLFGMTPTELRKTRILNSNHLIE